MMTYDDTDYQVEGLNMVQTCVLHTAVEMMEEGIQPTHEMLVVRTELSFDEVTQAIDDLIKLGWVPCKVMQ